MKFVDVLAWVGESFSSVVKNIGEEVEALSELFKSTESEEKIKIFYAFLGAAISFLVLVFIIDFGFRLLPLQSSSNFVFMNSWINSTSERLEIFGVLLEDLFSLVDELEVPGLKEFLERAGMLDFLKLVNFNIAFKNETKQQIKKHFINKIKNSSIDILTNQNYGKICLDDLGKAYKNFKEHKELLSMNKELLLLLLLKEHEHPELRQPVSVPIGQPPPSLKRSDSSERIVMSKPEIQSVEESIELVESQREETIVRPEAPQKDVTENIITRIDNLQKSITKSIIALIASLLFI